MLKSRRDIDYKSECNHSDAKRRCVQTEKTLIAPTENILWPDTDESFLSNSKLDDLLIDKAQEHSPNENRVKNNFHEDDLDDSLFNNVPLPDENSDGTNEGGTPLPQVFPSEINSNDTFFTEINWDEIVDKELERTEEKEISLFNDEQLEDVAIQNTQRFLHDVAFKIPKPPEPKSEYKGSVISKSRFEGTIQGTQYETREEIQNRTVAAARPTPHSDILELANLSHLNWETQVFRDMYTFPSKGDFYGLPPKVKALIFEHKGIQSLYEWQEECLNLPAIRRRQNLIYALPTSGGKTLVAEILMLREVICRQKNVLFILPYVAIVQEKVSAMSPFAIALDFIVDEYTAGKGKCPPPVRRKRNSIFIASIEKSAVLLDSLIEAERVNEIGLVVVDELHLIGEKGRGATLESLLTKIMFLNANIQIVGMSATIGNLTEISQFLNADVYTRGFRPVELKEYIKCGRDILEINACGKSIEEIFVFSRSVKFNYSAAVLRSDPDHLAGLVTECAPLNGCLIFCPSRRNCENVALLLSRILPKSKFVEHRRKEKEDLMDALDKICGILSPVLAKTIPYGVAYHHSGLTTDERKFIETAYRFGVLCVICCTSTLAAGVNLPAKRVIIRAPYVGAEFMTLCKYKQMVGRAGRAGLGETGESILISSSRDNVRVGEMLFSPMDRATSSLSLSDQIGLQSLILSAIGLGLACCRKDLYRLVNSTLLAVQSSCLGLSVESVVMDILREMFKSKVLQMCSVDRKRDCSNISTTQDVQGKSGSDLPDRRIFVGKTSRFELTTIGRAAFKAGIDYKRASAMYDELKFAQQQLILTNYAHLLYLVMCFSSTNSSGDELFSADAVILFRVYENLDEATQKLFQLLGFTEAHAVKIAKNMSIQGPMQLKLNRLFKVLILKDLLNLVPLPTVAVKYSIERGMLQSLTSQAISAASAIVRLCEEIEEFWCFKPLFERISSKMDRCGTVELEPLLDLPAVKINRAKQLYAAGFKSIEDIAKCRPVELVRAVSHMPLRVAKEINSAAKIILMKKLDHLEEETEALKMCLRGDAV